MRRSRRAALLAVGFGLLAALGIGEGLVRLAMRWSPSVEFLARAGQPSRSFDTLERYLASRAMHVVPHREWFNHWNNALGLHDEEFTVPKPPGRFRILALGDSFTYGIVPYPDAVMTLVETRLRAGCRGRDLDLLNFGIAGTGPRDYRILTTLALARFEADLVLVHFYAGNDGPDLYRRVHERSSRWSLLDHSRLLTLGRNVLRLRQGVLDHGTDRHPSSRGTTGDVIPRGGTVVDPTRQIDPRHPNLAGPTFTEPVFDAVLAEELRRLYTPPDPTIVEEAWRPVLEDLDAIRAQVARQGARLVLVVYPSALQVDPALLEGLVTRLRRRARYTPLSLDAIDPRLPNARLAAYCQRTGLSCFDLTPAFAEARQAPGEALYKAQDTHWTIRGNRVAAEAEAARLTGLVCP